MARWDRELPVPTSVTTGRKQSIPSFLTGLTLQIGDGSTAFDGTVSIEVSLDGVTWFAPQNVNLTGMTGVDIPKTHLETIDERVRWVRANVTVYNSGVAQILLYGTEE